MKLKVDKTNYIIEGFEDVQNIDDIADVLMCFLEKNELLIFGCADIRYFLDNLDNEEASIRDFYKKLIEYNNKQGTSIFREDDEWKENEKFIEQRTTFFNNGEDFPLNKFEKNRRTIWYRTSGKFEIIKALKINIDFKCIILNENSSSGDYKYALECYENESGRDLIIMEKEKDSFLNKVYPKISKIIDGIKFE